LPWSIIAGRANCDVATRNRNPHTRRRGDEQISLARLLGNLAGMAYRCCNDPDWTTEFVSDGCRELTGYAADDFRSGHVIYGDLIHLEDRQRLREDTQTALLEDRPFQLSWRMSLAPQAE